MATISTFPGFEKRCETILTSLQGLAGCKWFLEPVDISVFVDYPVRVKNPVDIPAIRKKLGLTPSSTSSSSSSNSNKRYTSHNEFATDIRRMVANFYIYNYDSGSSKLRRDVIRVLFNFETAWAKLSEEVQSIRAGAGGGVAFSMPLPELKEVIPAIEEVFKVGDLWPLFCTI